MSLAHTVPAQFSGVKIERASGELLWTEDGRELIDFTSGFGVAALGYGHPELRRAIAERYSQISHGICSVVPHCFENEAVDRVAALAPIEDPAVVLTTSGSEAVEVALKVASLATGRWRFVSLAGAYHGQSIGTLAVSAQRGPSVGLGHLVRTPPDVIPMPGYAAGDTGSAGESTALLLDHVRSLLAGDSLGDRGIAGVIVEPMQNLAGYRTMPHEFAAGLSNLCKEAGVPLIADEVFTGFGRCGQWSISNSLGLEPDIICFGKAMTGGIPGGACVAGRGLMKLLYPEAGAPLHAPTFYNAPVLAAAVTATVDLIERERLLDRASLIGERLRSYLDPVVAASSAVGEIRGLGAAQALVINTDDPSRRGVIVDHIVRESLQRGLLVLDSGFPSRHTISLCPPLTIGDIQLEQAIEVVVSVIQDAETL